VKNRDVRQAIVASFRKARICNLSVVSSSSIARRHCPPSAGFISHIRIPLIVKGEVIGVLSVGAKRHSAFTPNDMLTLEKIAGQIGVALENARLVSDLEELYDQLEKNNIKVIETAALIDIPSEDWYREQ